MCSISLDQILERVSVGPLLCVGRPVSDSGEVTETETVLHALLATRLLLLVALNIKKQTKKKPKHIRKNNKCCFKCLNRKEETKSPKPHSAGALIKSNVKVHVH